MGDDSYVLHQWTTDAADGIVESAGQGMDAINVLGADIDLTRSNLAAIENVTFTSDWEGRARTVMGNGRDNVILPHDANDPVEGRLGNDWLRGGSGNDTIHG